LPKPDGTENSSFVHVLMHMHYTCRITELGLATKEFFGLEFALILKVRRGGVGTGSTGAECDVVGVTSCTRSRLTLQHGPQ